MMSCHRHPIRSALFTDLYELTMARVYDREDMQQQAVFELFFREMPDARNYMIVAGVNAAVDAMENLRFTDDDLDYLAQQKEFAEAEGFLDRLRQFRFTGDVDAMAEILHDDLQQLLVGAKFQLSSLNRSPEEAVKRAASQVQDLLDQSIECSRSLTGELSPPILHEAGLIAGLEWLAVWMQQKHGMNIELQTQESAAPESEDMRILLFQSVRELLFNAVKHAKVKTAQVRLRRLDDHVEVTVSDNGAGFDPQETIAREGRTGGFGLFSIRERLDLLGGKMEIDSAPGRGSRFTLHAPLWSAAPTEQQPPATLAGVRISRTGPLPGSASGAASSADHRIRVLLVDDHVVVRQGLSHLLREEPDIEVVAEASDGQTAIDMVRQFAPDVVTMDISMPGMDGIEATKIIHADFPDVKVIGLSMFEEKQRAKAMLEAGAVKYLAKSGPSDALIAAIRACADVADQRAVRPSTPPE